MPPQMLAEMNVLMDTLQYFLNIISASALIVLAIYLIGVVACGLGEWRAPAKRQIAVGKPARPLRLRTHRAVHAGLRTLSATIINPNSNP